MKVLFVYGGNLGIFKIPPLIKAQGDSLGNNGVKILYFPIIGRGFLGYLSNIGKIKKYLKANSIDLIHAHYSFAGLFISLSKTKIPVIVSLLGSDVNSPRFINKTIIKSIKFLSWDSIIVKSLEMSKKIPQTNNIIPNGVNTEMFKPLDRVACQNKLNWDSNKKHVLFAANPNRIEKNFTLTKKAVDLLNDDNIELHHFENVEHRYIPLWLNASDLVVLSSLWEGSPNVIKEAMACNRPIVATNVGDIKWLFGNELGHFLAENDFIDFSNKIELGLEYSDQFHSTNARKRIFELKLDSNTVAKKIIDIYKGTLSGQKQ